MQMSVELWYWTNYDALTHACYTTFYMVVALALALDGGDSCNLTFSENCTHFDKFLINFFASKFQNTSEK